MRKAARGNGKAVRPSSVTGLAQLKPIAKMCANLSEILAKAQQSQGVRRVCSTVCLIHFLSGVK